MPTLAVDKHSNNKYIPISFPPHCFWFLLPIFTWITSMNIPNKTRSFHPPDYLSNLPAGLPVKSIVICSKNE